MKKFLTSVWILVSVALSAQDTFFNDADAFFRTYVHHGRVDYAAVVRQPESLQALVDQAARVEFGRASQNTQIAYYINLYNLLVIHQVVQQYPVRSPKDLAGFFDARKYEVGGKNVSLNTLEHVLLAGVKPDARYHFVLVCGALGCPKLASEAVRPETLESFLDQQTQAALNDPEFVRVQTNGSVGLSQIFEWYAKDFSEGAVAFINRYRTTPLPANASTSFYTYDWTLNDATPPFPLPSETPTPPTTAKSNVQAYTPSVLLKKGQTDVTLFNSIYTQTRSNWLGVDYSGTRETFAGSWIQITRGVSKNARINVGLEINLKASARTTDTSFAGIGEAFQFKNDIDHRVGLSTVGAKVKIAPFKSVPNFSFESIVWIPVNSNVQGTNELYFLDWNRPIWWNRFYFDKSFGDWQLFSEVDLLFRIPVYDGQKQAVDLPVSVIVSYFPSPKTTVYALAQHMNRYRFDTRPDLADTDGITTPASYSTWGVGGKYQLTDQLQVELLYSNFWRAVNAGFGQTYNLGFKYIF